MPKRGKRARQAIANLRSRAKKRRKTSKGEECSQDASPELKRGLEIGTSYAIPNSTLIKELNLIKHPEGGYFAETDRQPQEVPSPFANGAPRSLATTIYYLLTPDQPNGVFHMNKSATMHVLHQGRAEYTLITPGTPPRVEHKVMGSNVLAGEVLQLLVPSGVWKMSRLLSADVSSPDRERVGCLITEVVFPGFAWEDHGFLTRDGLEALYGGAPGQEEWVPYVKGEAAS